MQAFPAGVTYCTDRAVIGYLHYGRAPERRRIADGTLAGLVYAPDWLCEEEIEDPRRPERVTGPIPPLLQEAFDRAKHQRTGGHGGLPANPKHSGSMGKEARGGPRRARQGKRSRIDDSSDSGTPNTDHQTARRSSRRVVESTARAKQALRRSAR